MSDDPYIALSAESLARLQILDDAGLRLGSALMTVGGEPSVDRAVILSMTHHSNMTQESETTLFGLDEDALMSMAAGLLIMVFVAYGDDGGAAVLRRVGQHLAQVAADQDDDDSGSGGVVLPE